MDRLYFVEVGHCPGDAEYITSSKGICLYDGNNKTDFVNETAQLTSTCLYFTSSKRPTLKLVLELKCVVLMEEEAGGLLKSNKIILHLTAVENEHYPKPIPRSVAAHIKLGFSAGHLAAMKSSLSKVLADRAWERMVANFPLRNPPVTSSVTRSGIVGIERKMQEKIDNTSSNINLAFQDLKKLMEMAKDMVQLANIMSNKLKDRQGDISEDDTIKFKSYLLSLGIDDPVTRDAYSSSDAYRKQLSKQIADFLLPSVSQMGGIMVLTDAYCRMNRARGFELLSPEDFYQACRQMKGLQLPLKLRTFDSGVVVLQLQSQPDTLYDQETARLLQDNKALTAYDMSQILGISVSLAFEKLYSAERAGFVCRDESIRGLVFYPNLFLTN